VRRNELTRNKSQVYLWKVKKEKGGGIAGGKGGGSDCSYGGKLGGGLPRQEKV